MKIIINIAMVYLCLQILIFMFIIIFFYVFFIIIYNVLSL